MMRTSARRMSSQDYAHVAVFAALIAALGLPGALAIGGLPVPITLQTLGVMLAGAVLGARKGFLAVLLFCVLTAAGLPLLSGGRGGIGAFTVSPSAGYLYGWLLGVSLIGWLTRMLLPRYRLALAWGATCLGGVLAVYALGVPVTAMRAGVPLWAAALDALKFLPGDLLKVTATVLIARQVHRAYPDLIGPREPERVSTH